MYSIVFFMIYVTLFDHFWPLKKVQEIIYI